MNSCRSLRPDTHPAPVVSLVSLGCAKNTVDSEIILGRFVEAGWMIAEDPADADVCLVNTCGFIRDAREEVASVLHELRALKGPDGPAAIVALGCLVKRAADRPEFDPFLGPADARASFADYSRLPEICMDLLGEKSEPGRIEGYHDFLLRPRLRIGSPHSAWLKIAEGCSNSCTFCSIPQIRGPQISRPMDDILSEARALLEAGAVELNLIAQDTTAYGRDLDGEFSLAALLQRLRDELDEDVWFRLMYACPQHLTGEVLAVLASDPRFCPYIDMPLQHISDAMLRAMGRPLGRFQTLKKLDQIRSILPDGAIRTAFIVGHPGETETDFEELLDFVREGRFTHAGVFTYSSEPGTPSGQRPDDVPADVKEQRRVLLMEAQREVSAEHCAARVGQTLEVMIDGEAQAGLLGRLQQQAPEVDGAVFLPPIRDAVPGDRLGVTVTDAGDYDLFAE